MTAARSKTPTTRAHTQAQCSVEIGDAEEGISGIQAAAATVSGELPPFCTSAVDPYSR